jgi:hypothetical protein
MLRHSRLGKVQPTDNILAATGLTARKLAQDAKAGRMRKRGQPSGDPLVTIPPMIRNTAVHRLSSIYDECVTGKADCGDCRIQSRVVA